MSGGRDVRSPSDERIRLRDLWAETLSDMTSRPLGTLLRSLTAALVGAAIVTLTAHEVDAIVHQYQAEVASGRYVWQVVSPAESGTLSIARCTALEAVNGVVAAGGVLQEEKVHFANQPLATYDFQRVTAGYLEAVSPGLSPGAVHAGGIILGSLVAQNIGAVPNSDVSISGVADTGTRRINVAGVLAASERDSDVDRIVFEVSPPLGATRSCLVDATPAASNQIGSLLGGWFPPATGASARPLLIDRTTGLTAEERFASRATRYSWPSAGGVLAFVIASSWFARRADLTLYRALGIGPFRIVAMCAMELVTSLIVPLVLGATVSIAVLASSLTRLAPLLMGAGVYATLLALLPVPLLVLVWVRKSRIVDGIKGL